jgi:periplasmic protein TonB
MRTLRPLLRLDDKVAAESRRLEHLGGPPMRGVAVAALVAAASLHVLALFLPVAHSASAAPPQSLPTDFPLVWRPAPAPAPRPAPVVAPPKKPLAPPPCPPAASVPPAAPLVRFASAPRPLLTEPVPEPPPDVALATISAEVEAIIPNPDSPPLPGVVGPDSFIAPDTSPSLITSVRPVYPLAARTIQAEGRVTLRLSVMPDGHVGRAIVEGCSRPGLGFEAAAVAAVKLWRYEPSPLQAGPRKVTVTVDFQRKDARP